MIVQDAKVLESCRPLSNDERRAVWAMAFYGGGFHRDNDRHDLIHPSDSDNYPEGDR